MSASAATLHCPVCLGDGVFSDSKSLKHRLIHILNVNISCPICQEEQVGVSKLITHLTNHLNIADTSNNFVISTFRNAENNRTNKSHIHSKLEERPKENVTVNRMEATEDASPPLKYVKIYPKLPVVSFNVTPEIDTNLNTFCQVSATQDNNQEHNTMCVVCGLRFIDSVVLKMHLSLIHNIEDNSVKQCSRHQCHLCPKNFKMRGSLMVHLRVAHFGFPSKKILPKQNDQDGRTQVSDFSPIVLKNENKQWQCDVCEKYFTTKYFLKKHKRLHTGETPYACAQCNKTFTFQQSYHKHLLYHNDEKPHSCQICGRAFKELSTLHNHQRIHTGEKPFSCEICGKSFRQRVSYLVHKRIHTGVMPYKCTACNKSFRYKVSQRTHKCTSQPPGVVIRQSVNLLDKLKNKCIENKISEISIVKDRTAQNFNYTAITPENKVFKENDLISSYEISEANADLVRSGALLSLEDTETESFNLLAHIVNENNVNNDVPSPSEKLEKLCLTSNFCNHYT